MKCLTCDFGGSSLKYALIDENGVLEHLGKMAAPLYSIEQFTDSVYGLYMKYKSQIDGIAISIPGYINPETGFLKNSGAYQALYNHSVIDLLKAKCPVNIAVENDGKCGALAEAWNGALNDVNDGVVLILGSAVAGGIIKNRKVHWGKEFVAGELSFLLTNPGEYTYMSMSMMHVGIVGMTYKLCKMKNLDIDVQDFSPLLRIFDEIFGDRYLEMPEEERKEIKADGRQIFKWLDEGDGDAAKVYTEFIQSLAVMIFNVQIMYAPEKIVIGGGLSRQDRILRDVRQELDRYYCGMDLADELRSTIVRSKYLDECNMVGAMYNYMLHFPNNN